jgi:hypothetical protein
VAIVARKTRPRKRLPLKNAFAVRAFSSEVETGSRQENLSK